MSNITIELYTANGYVLPLDAILACFNRILPVVVPDVDASPYYVDGSLAHYPHHITGSVDEEKYDLVVHITALHETIRNEQDQAEAFAIAYSLRELLGDDLEVAVMLLRGARPNFIARGDWIETYQPSDELSAALELLEQEIAALPVQETELVS